MTRSREPRDESVAVGHHELRLVRRHAGAFGIDDARIQPERRRLAAARKVDRFIHRQVPRVVQVEVTLVRLSGHEVGVRQAGAIIVGGESCNGQRLVDRVMQGPLREIRRVGMALLLSHIHRDAHALVAVVLDVLDFVSPDRDALPEAF